MLEYISILLDLIIGQSEGGDRSWKSYIGRAMDSSALLYLEKSSVVCWLVLKLGFLLANHIFGHMAKVLPFATVLKGTPA